MTNQSALWGQEQMKIDMEASHYKTHEIWQKWKQTSLLNLQVDYD